MTSTKWRFRKEKGIASAACTLVRSVFSHLLSREVSIGSDEGNSVKNASWKFTFARCSLFDYSNLHTLLPFSVAKYRGNWLERAYQVKNINSRLAPHVHIVFKIVKCINLILFYRGRVRNEQESVPPVQRDHFHFTNRIVDLVAVVRAASSEIQN